MEYDRLRRTSSQQPILIAATALAARQWEAWLLTQSGAGGHASRSLPLVGYEQWLQQLWEDDPGAERPLLLGRAQSLAAWRQIIEDHAADFALIGSDVATRWAMDAWQRLLRFGVDVERLQAGEDQPDLRAFLLWCRAYRRRLHDAGWIDIAGAESRLAEAPLPSPRRVCLLNLHEQWPSQQRLFEQLARAGWQVDARALPGALNRTVTLPLQDPDRELQAAVEWARQRLGASPRSRVALVIGDLQDRVNEVQRTLASGSAGFPVWLEYESPITAHSLIGAALSGVELLSPQGGFNALSRWLRSPFFQGLDPEASTAAAAIEAGLRDSMLAQLTFREAYRAAGLAARLHREAPVVAAKLEAALDEVGNAGRHRTPTQWANRWQRALRHLGWPATMSGADDTSMRAWESALEDFARLTPMLGPLSPRAAEAELHRVLQRTRPRRPLPPTGVHVFAEIDAVGPGYQSVWVTGLSDRHWPPPPRINPLLPRELQVRHGMPDATPRDALERARRALERLRARVDQLVLSWPEQVLEQATEPSPLIRGLPSETPSALGLPGQSPAPLPRFDPTRIEVLEDSPSPLTGKRVSGGAGTLNKQARCPLRAFCEGRLGARPLDVPSRGLSAHARGIVAHRALELWAQRIVEAPARCADGAGTRQQDLVVDCVEQALTESFASARKSFARLFDLERRRYAALVSELLSVEATRKPFRIVTTEQRADIELGPWTISCRIDRVDRLEDGTLAVIDYKTGRGSRVRDWFRDRLLDTQLPVYALHRPANVRALVIVTLQRRAIAYQGTWQTPHQFPGRAAPLPEGRDWPGQLAVWREQIEQLIEEYAGGDVRLFDADLDLAKGAYAPLSRVYEHLAGRQARHVDG